jgi:hypothetical protein
MSFMGMKLLSHLMKLSLVSPHKYHVTSTKLNARETPPGDGRGLAGVKDLQLQKAFR